MNKLERKLIDLENAIRAVRIEMRNGSSQETRKEPDSAITAWLCRQSGEVTSSMVAEQVFGAEKGYSRSASMRAAHALRACGWVGSRKVQGVRYWKRGVSAVQMPRPSG